jgi:NAD kinase
MKPEDLKLIEFEYDFYGTGKMVTEYILYNETVISEEEVNRLIETEMYENDHRVVVMSPTQVKNIFKKE